MSTKKNSNVLAIIVMILLFGMISFVTNLASPMGDVLKNQFEDYISDWMGTLGVFANFIAYAFMGIPAGNLLQKRGYKFTALAAVAVGFTGVGVQVIAGLLDGSTAFGVYLLGAFIAGFSMCMLNIVVNPMLNKLAGGGNRGNQLLQLGGSFNSLMGTAVIALVGILIPSMVKASISDVYPLMFTALAIFALAFVVILFTKIPENENIGTVSKDNSKIGPMSFRHFVLGAIGIFIYVGVEVGIPKELQSWLNVHLAQEETVVAQQDGIIKEVLVKKKYEVEEGDVLATMDVTAEDGTVTTIDIVAPNTSVIVDIPKKDKEGNDTKWTYNIEPGTKVEKGQVIAVIDKAFAGPIAGTVAATYWLLMLVGRLLGAALGARISSKKMLAAVSSFGILLVVGAIFLDPANTVNLPVFQNTGFGMAEVPINAALLVLCGLCTSVMWGGIFNLAAEGLGRYTERASGIFMALVCGGGILPLLQEMIISQTGGNYLVSYWVIVAGLAYLLFYALVGSKNVNKDIKTE